MADISVSITRDSRYTVLKTLWIVNIGSPGCPRRTVHGIVVPWRAIQDIMSMGYSCYHTLGGLATGDIWVREESRLALGVLVSTLDI
jgi:hypothetical protein